MTNLAVINQATTLGTQTGDLAGAVSAVILSVTPGANGTTVFKVQHHFVTEAGYTITAALRPRLLQLGYGARAKVRFLGTRR